MSAMAGATRGREIGGGLYTGREKKKEKEGGTGGIGTSAHTDSRSLALRCGSSNKAR